MHLLSSHPEVQPWPSVGTRSMAVVMQSNTGIPTPADGAVPSPSDLQKANPLVNQSTSTPLLSLLDPSHLLQLSPLSRHHRSYHRGSHLAPGHRIASPANQIFLTSWSQVRNCAVACEITLVPAFIQVLLTSLQMSEIGGIVAVW